MITTKEQLDLFIGQNWDLINEYIDQKMNDLPIPFYSSIDIRESRNKYAPIDHNIYPAGFNNLCLLDLEAASREILKTIKSSYGPVENILIFPESHTKNLFYLDHLAILGKAVRDAGFNVTFGTTAPEVFITPEAQKLNLVSQSGYDLEINRLTVADGRFKLKDRPEVEFQLCLLNNDQSSPLEIDWDKIKCPVIPTPKIGWFKRQKDIHFCYYGEVVKEFCQHFSIKEDLIQAKFKSINQIDFQAKEGLEELAQVSEKMLEELKQVDPDPRIFIKAAQGTYGMGISVIRSSEEIREMNRKIRNKMDIGKNKKKFTSVLLQESVGTVIKYDEMPAEITIYQINGKSIGGFMRANPERDDHSNLNSKGMVFKKFCISEIRQNQDHGLKEAVYSIIARLSTWASAYEIKQVLSENKSK